jgi:hypothetical protein
MGCPTQIKLHPDGGGTITLQNGEISVSRRHTSTTMTSSCAGITMDSIFDGGVDGKPAVTAIHLLDPTLRSLPVAAQLQVPHLTA